ncbi:rhombosortase [Pseudidiomarina sp. E22-M8]|uniref:rhombosortase n=1 Tax=Pseudidiomarina sp. E22-M8 TaxID=3424768 RepID=UPI00403C63E8
MKLHLPLRVATLWPLLTLTVLMLAIMLLPSAWQEQLVMSRSSLEQGGWWQLASSQLVHHSWSHFGVNLAGLLLWWLLYAESLEVKFWWIGFFLMLLTSSTAQWLFDPSVQFYAGFSGTLYGLFTWGAIRDCLERRWTGAIILAGIIFKLIWDATTQQSAGGIAVVAHLGGVIAAVIFAICHYTYSRLSVDFRR